MFQSSESFLLQYCNVRVPGPYGQSMKLAKMWLDWPQRKTYFGVTFLPGGPKEVNGRINIWQGWGVTPRPGDWNLIQDHIFNVLAGGDADCADYIIRWLAWSVQNPAKQAEVALVLIGEKGTGKGTLARCLEQLFGAHLFQAQSQEHVIGRFNDHLHDCVLFIADEAYWGGDKKCVGRLQGMITEPTLTIEPKGVGVFRVPNYLHVVMLAEPGWVIPAGKHERRYASFDVSSCRRGDKAYFKALHQQIGGGGAAAMFHDLGQMDLDDWHPREMPDTVRFSSALRRQQAKTLPPMERWYISLLMTGRLPMAKKKKPHVTLSRHLVSQGKDFSPRLRQDLDEYSLKDFLTDQSRIGVTCDKVHTVDGNGWSFPPLAECREAIENLYGPQQWTPITEWSEKLREETPDDRLMR